MSILSYKYKAHKLVNTLFYVVVFVIGFLLGFGAEKIDFDKLVSQVLMIDNAKAYTIVNDIDESKMVEMFSTNEDFDITIQHNIICFFRSSSLQCYALSDEALNHFTFSYTVGGKIKLDLDENYSLNSNPSYAFKLNYNKTSKTFTIDNINTWTYGISADFTYSSYSNGIYLSFIPTGYENDSWVKSKKLLDFSEYSVKVEYNENLFKDNPDFKEVCVPNNKKFGIISKEYNVDENITDETLNNRYYVDRDYIWFPNGVKGLSTFFYHNKSENNVKVIDKDDVSYSMYGYWYWLNSKEEIDKYFGELPTSAMLQEGGYTDKYKYYNYTMHPFLIRYIGYEDDYMFSVFWFKELGVNHIDSDVIDYPEEYCFFIKNKYDVVLFNSNEWGDLYTDITILGDKDITISTSQNEADVNNVGIFSVVNNFIYQIKGTIIFINTNIHNLFLAMPLLVRMFILSVLTILIIKFLIDMIVR